MESGRLLFFSKLPRTALIRSNLLGQQGCSGYRSVVDKTVKRFASFAAAEKADREFYKNLSGNERLKILLELINHAPEQRLERVSRIIKRPRR